jgi:tetratricopeptide (TPR) repeat protein
MRGEPEVRDDLVLEELARVREEVVNTRNLTIKTENALKLLATEVKTVARRQEQQEKKALLNSFGAYLLFVVVVGGGLWLTFQARLEKSKADHALFSKKESQFQHDIDELRAELGRWQQVERELLEFERLVKDGNKEKAVEAFSSLRKLRYAGLLEDLIIRFKAEVAREKYDRGVELYTEGNFGKADESFIKSLEYDEKPPYMSMLLFHQGMAAVRLKDFPRGAELLRKAIAGNLDGKYLSEASYHLAYCHDRMGEKRSAREHYFRFFSRYTRNMYTPLAKRRWEQLKGD